MTDAELEEILLARGDLVTGVDGFVVYWPVRNVGALAPHDLRRIAGIVDKMNQPWQDLMEEFFND